MDFCETSKSVFTNINSNPGVLNKKFYKTKYCKSYGNVTSLLLLLSYLIFFYHFELRKPKIKQDINYSISVE